MLTFAGSVRDSVYKQIPYTETEKELMDTVQFRRLQSIKQQSTLDWTISTAEHTRYSHSLGVMHIADRIAVQLGLPDDERQIIRIAALLHDIGHYPLSHVCEYAYHEDLGELPVLQDVNTQVLDQIKKLGDDLKQKKGKLSNEDTDQLGEINGHKIPKDLSHKKAKESDKALNKIYYMRPASGLHHEKFGADIVYYREEIRKIITEDPIIRASKYKDSVFYIITDMIVGNVSRDSITDPLFVQILHSEMDADGIDYVMRDSYFAGTSYGTFDVEQLISSMCAVKIPSGHRILCIKPEGITAADSYLTNKFNAYVNSTFDKNVVVSDWMVKQVMLWLQQDGKFFKSRTQLNKVARSADNTWYETFTDDYFGAIIGDIANGNYPKAPEMIVRICQKIRQHSPLDYVDGSEVKILSRDDGEIYERLSGSPAYKELSENRGKFYYRKDPSLQYHRIALRNKKKLSKQMPEEKFREKLAIVEADVPDWMPDGPSLTDRRRMECVTVWDEDAHDLHLLCDDERSLMRFLYDVEVNTLRLYELP